MCIQMQTHIHAIDRERKINERQALRKVIEVMENSVSDEKGRVIAGRQERMCPESEKQCERWNVSRKTRLGAEKYQTSAKKAKVN